MYEPEVISLPYLVVLVGCDCDELGLREEAGFKGAVGKLLDVIRLHNVKPWLIFVHRIENRLQKKITTRVKQTNLFLICYN